MFTSIFQEKIITGLRRAELENIFQIQSAFIIKKCLEMSKR
jgi:hypothetical protein